jgi:hypothetical protein
VILEIVCKDAFIEVSLLAIAFLLVGLFLSLTLLKEAVINRSHFSLLIDSVSNLIFFFLVLTLDSLLVLLE